MIELKNLNLELFDELNREHSVLLKKVSSNIGTQTFVSKDLEKFIKKDSNGKNFSEGATYVVKDKDDVVGFVGSKKINSKNNLEIWCAIDPDKRGKNYATKILEQITPYLIENIDNLNDIMLVIDRRNIYSQKVAKKVGYVGTNKKDDYDTYRYFGK